MNLRRVSRTLCIAAVMFCVVRPCAAQHTVAEGTALLQKGRPVEAAALWNEIIASGDDVSAAEAHQKLKQHEATLARAFKEKMSEVGPPGEPLRLLIKAFPERPEPHIYWAAWTATDGDVPQTIEHVTEAVNKGATLEDLMSQPRINLLLDMPEKGILFEKFVNETFGPEVAARMREQGRAWTNQVEMHISHDGESEVEADQRLNTAYNALRKSLDETAKQRLKREQLEWISRRDALKAKKFGERTTFISDRASELESRLSTTASSHLTSTAPQPNAGSSEAGIDRSISADEAERQLTTAYTALRKTMNDAEKEALKREQIPWIKRKDAITDPASRSKFIQERTAELKRRLDP